MQTHRAAAVANLLRAAGEHLGNALADKLVDRADWIVREPGEWIYAERDDATGLTVITAGQVRIQCGTTGGLSVVIGLAGPGAVLGQSAILGGGPRLHTMICETRTTVARIPAAAILDLASGNPEVWKAVVSLLYRQLQGTLQVLVECIALPPIGRVAARLAMLAGPDGAIAIDQGTLAESLGLSRKTVNRHLAAFEAEGLVSCGYRRIVVRDAAGLRLKAHSAER